MPNEVRFYSINCRYLPLKIDFSIERIAFTPKTMHHRTLIGSNKQSERCLCVVRSAIDRNASKSSLLLLRKEMSFFCQIFFFRVTSMHAQSIWTHTSTQSYVIMLLSFTGLRLKTITKKRRRLRNSHTINTLNHSTIFAAATATAAATTSKTKQKNIV